MAKNSESKPGAPAAPAAPDTAGGKGKPKKSPSAAAGAGAATAKGGAAASGKKGAAVAAGAGQAQAGAAPATPKTPSGSPALPAGNERQQKPAYVPRLRRRYLEEVVPKLKREFGIENTMAVPRLERISLNMGMGEAIQNIKILDDAVEEMAALAGQRPTVTRSQKSIAAFKLRAGMPSSRRRTCARSSLPAVVTMVMFMPFERSTLL